MRVSFADNPGLVRAIALGLKRRMRAREIAELPAVRDAGVTHDRIRRLWSRSGGRGKFLQVVLGEVLPCKRTRPCAPVLSRKELETLACLLEDEGFLMQEALQQIGRKLKPIEAFRYILRRFRSMREFRRRRGVP